MKSSRPIFRAEDEEAGRSIVSDSVGDPDVSGLDPAIDDLERRYGPCGRGRHVGGRELFIDEIVAEYDGDPEEQR